MKTSTARLYPIMAAFSPSDPPLPSVADTNRQSDPNSGFNSQVSIQPEDNR